MVKKIGFGAGFWAVMFLGVSALIVTPIPSWLMIVLEIILAGAAGYVLGVIYFKKEPTDMVGGLVTAIIWLATATVLDLLLTVQYTRGVGGNYVDGLKNFYGAWQTWASFLVFIGAVVLAAKMTHGGEVIKKPVTKPVISQPQPQKSTPPQQPPTPPTGGNQPQQ